MKKELINHYWRIYPKFMIAYRWGILNNLKIYPVCITNRATWSISVDIYDKNDNIQSHSSSSDSGKYYHTEIDYEIKVMELYIFYYEAYLRKQKGHNH